MAEIVENEANEANDTDNSQNIPQIGQPVEDILEVDKSNIKRTSRARNYSFADKLANPQKAAKYETVDVAGIGEVSIPATIGSTYWAIMRVCYENANIPLYPDKLVKLVEELMEDAFPDRWKAYIEKSETTVYSKVKQERDRKKISTWQERIVNNAKTLMRGGGNSQYGLRLIERGHRLSFEYDSKKKQCFILRTSECVKQK